MDPAFATVAIVGAGQVGTAIGCCLRRAGAARRVLVHDRDDAVARRSLALGSGDRAVGLVEALGADAVVLALPLDAVLAVIARHGAAFRDGALVIDTATIKAPVTRAMRSLRPAVHAIGGHPLAGTERPGPEGADPDGLRGATFALTPARDDPAAVERGRALVAGCGARPLVVAAEEHDAAVARTIGLPHLVAFALRSVTRDADLAGPGFRGATRLAAADPAQVAAWSVALVGDLRPALADLRAALDRFERSLDDPAALARELAG